MSTPRNWLPVIASLVRTLQDHAITITAIDNGCGKVHTPVSCDTPRKVRQWAKQEICATDESHIYVTTPDKPGTAWIFVVLGNEPEETVSDYTDRPSIDKAVEAFSKRWEGVACPVNRSKN